MNLSILDELQPIAEELQRHMSSHVLEHLAKETGFVQRRSKYQAQELVALCVWLSQQVASTSLTQLCSCLEVSTGVLISPEGLNLRFNASAVKFLEQVLANLLTQRIHSTQERSKRLSGINVYITNLSVENVPTEHFHNLYSLRWQIEILFKTWKSFFQIHKCKEIKKERLECHLYGQLISILLCSSTMFKMRQLLLDKKKKELSEYKSIYMIKNYYLLFYQG